MFNLSAKVNSKQKSILFDAMLRYRHILEARTFALRSSKNEVWGRLTAQLNMHGPQKDVSQWKKCFTDLRLAIRKRKLKSMKRKEELINRSLNNYERQIFKVSRIRGIVATDVESSPIVDEVVDDAKIKEEQSEEKEEQFEEVILPTLEPEINQDLVGGTVKIEVPELSPNGFTSENDTLFLSRESPNQENSSYPSRDFLNRERSSPLEHQTATSDPAVPGERSIQELYLMEILKESRKQTALLEKLIDRLAQ